MSANEAAATASRLPALCVSIHDVAPATWNDCLRLHDAVRAVADIPMTWLVVPCYHGRSSHSAPMESCLEALLAAGHELALHGYTHRDDAPAAPSLSLLQRWTRTVYTRSEGEFANLGEAQARARIALGRAWFAARGWPVSGFVAPAWLLGPGAWRALTTPCAAPDEGAAASLFRYTTTLARFHWLRPAHALWTPSLVYTARNRAGRMLSPLAIDMAGPVQRNAALVRLSLHPSDARHPALMRHMQHVLAQLLQHRHALTKAAFADAYEVNEAIQVEKDYQGPQKLPPRHRP